MEIEMILGYVKLAIICFGIGTVLFKSVIFPENGRIYIRVFFNGFLGAFGNIDEYKWENNKLIPLTDEDKVHKPGFFSKLWSNIYFCLWPLIRLHHIEYTDWNLIKIGDKNNDRTIWEDVASGQCAIERLCKSDSLEFRIVLLAITQNVRARGLIGNFVIQSNTTIDVTDPQRLIFTTGLNDAFKLLREGINSKVLELGSESEIVGLGSLKNFSARVRGLNKGTDNDNQLDGLEEVGGFKVVHSDFVALIPSDKATQDLMESFGLVETAKQTGEAAKIKAAADAIALESTEGKNIDLAKRRLLETGLAKEEAGGKVVRVPDPNLQIPTETAKALASFNGNVLIVGNSSSMPIIDVNQKKGD